MGTSQFAMGQVKSSGMSSHLVPGLMPSLGKQLQGYPDNAPVVHIREVKRQELQYLLNAVFNGLGVHIYGDGGGTDYKQIAFFLADRLIRAENAEIADDIRADHDGHYLLLDLLPLHRERMPEEIAGLLHEL